MKDSCIYSPGVSLTFKIQISVCPSCHDRTSQSWFTGLAAPSFGRQRCCHYCWVSRRTVRSHHHCARTPIQPGRPEIICSIPAGSQWSPETCGPLADCWAEAVMEWVIKRDESINSAWDNACGERELKGWQEGNVDLSPMSNILVLSICMQL